MFKISSITLIIALYAAVGVNALEETPIEYDCSAEYPCNDKSERNLSNCECDCLEGAELTCESW